MPQPGAREDRRQPAFPFQADAGIRQMRIRRRFLIRQQGKQHRFVQIAFGQLRPQPCFRRSTFTTAYPAHDSTPRTGRVAALRCATRCWRHNQPFAVEQQQIEAVVRRQLRGSSAAANSGAVCAPAQKVADQFAATGASGLSAAGSRKLVSAATRPPR